MVFTEEQLEILRLPLFVFEVQLETKYDEGNES